MSESPNNIIFIACAECSTDIVDGDYRFDGEGNVICRECDEVEDTVICGACRGSGMGVTPKQRCRVCKGRGEITNQEALERRMEKAEARGEGER